MEFFRFNFFALGTNNEISLFAENKDEADRLFTVAVDEISRIEKKYSRYLPGSIVSQINASAGNKPVIVDEETAGLINFAAACNYESSGLFDITSGTLRRAWDFKAKCLPKDSDVAKLLPLIGWEKVSWSVPEIFLPIRGMEIDFGGFGKEYAVDRAADALSLKGAKHALVNLGGDLRAVGPRADSSPWKVGITHPRSTGHAITHLELTTGALATSGDYERYFEIGGKRYSHLLNPKTGYPISGFQSVSILHELCLIAGSIATMAMLKGKLEACKYIESLGVSFIVINEKSEIVKDTFSEVLSS